jgi:acetamidase/formamidase
MAKHSLAATPKTVRRGSFDGSYPPVLTVQPGDTVVLQSISGMPHVMPAPDAGFSIPPALAEVMAAGLQGSGAHLVTGPVAIAGAEPGDMLEVRIDAIELGADWGYCAFHPLIGSLPEEFPYRDVSHIPVDVAKRTCRLPWGPEIPLAPFFGIMAVAPPLNYGTVSTREPRAYGGNMDNKELTAGSTLFLPVWVPGANFTAGDGHGVQGDGESCVNALEICLNGTFTFLLHKGGGPADPVLSMPRAETPTHYIAMGFDADLDDAMKKALKEMMAFICARTGWTQAEAYKTCSLVVDFKVTQNVNGEKGVHGMLKKGLLF